MKLTFTGSTPDSRIAWFVESSEMDGVSLNYEKNLLDWDDLREPGVEGLDEICSGDPILEDSTNE